MALKPMKICCAEAQGMLLNRTFLKLNVVICVLIVNICTCGVKVNKSLPYPCCKPLSVREVVPQSQNTFSNPVKTFM